MKIDLLSELTRLNKEKKQSEKLALIEKGKQTKIENESSKFNKLICCLLQMNNTFWDRHILIDNDVLKTLKTPEEKVLYILTWLIAIKKELWVQILRDFREIDNLSFVAIARELEEYTKAMSVDWYAEFNPKTIQNIIKWKWINLSLDYNSLREKLLKTELVPEQEIDKNTKEKEWDNIKKRKKANFQIDNTPKDEIDIFSVSIEKSLLKEIDINYNLDNLDLSKISYTRNWIKSYEELKQKINKLEPRIKVRYKVMINRFENIKYIIKWQDPIKYIAYLYYKKELSIGWIHNELSSLWINWPADTLEKNFRDLFLWKKRSDKEAANVKIRNEKCQKNKKDKTRTNSESIINHLWEWENIFSSEQAIEYLKLTNTNQRVKFILEELGYIQFWKFKKYIIFLNTTFWPHATTKALCMFLEWITSANNFAKINYNKARLYELINDL